MIKFLLSTNVIKTVFLSSQKKAVRDNNDTAEMILELKSFKLWLFCVYLWCILKIFTISVTFVHAKVISKEICEKRYISLFILKTMPS